MNNRVTRLLNIDYPIIQAGMVWTSGWRLAAAVSNAGALGVIGAGSMQPDLLREHIIKCKQATNKPFAVNLPLLQKGIAEQIDIILNEKVPIAITSAGNPKTWTSILKKEGVKVIHVIGSTSFALKAEEAGCDAVVAEGFEAGGHNSREETTTLVLVPAVVNAVKIPVIAAGGLYSGRSMAAMMILGAEGVQLGTRFVCSQEASCHNSFKERVIHSNEGDTKLMMKAVVPVRLLKNSFSEQVAELERKGASKEEYLQLLGRGRSMRGMFQGDLEEGELEIGQVSALIHDVLPAATIVHNIWNEFEDALAIPVRRF